MDHSNPTFARIPILDTEKFEQWKFIIQQYLQNEHYALWEVIEFGDSYKAPPEETGKELNFVDESETEAYKSESDVDENIDPAQTTTNIDGTSTTLIPGPITTKEKVQKKNDVKVRIMLQMALPNEHIMTFNQYKDAKTLFAAIQIRFGGNEATKKTQKTLVKQMYENFSALSTESLDSIFNRLQKIVCQLAILGENISQEHLNLKILRSLPSEWNLMLCTNEVNTAYGVSTANTQVSPASTQVSTASTQVSTANLSDATVYAFLTSQPNGSQLVHEDPVHVENKMLQGIPTASYGDPPASTFFHLNFVDESETEAYKSESDVDENIDPDVINTDEFKSDCGSELDVDYARKKMLRENGEQTQMKIAQKEEAGIQLNSDEFDFMAATRVCDEIEEVNANYTFKDSLQQASTPGTQTDNAPVYDSDG
nr:ribonuclease H-like domain-containing protein [Tanacetum cinerariifolium]